MYSGTTIPQDTAEQISSIADKERGRLGGTKLSPEIANIFEGISSATLRERQGKTEVEKFIQSGSHEAIAASNIKNIIQEFKNKEPDTKEITTDPTNERGPVRGR